jgi:hypothetical protein
MLFSARTLRVAIRSPTAAVKHLAMERHHPVSEDTPRNPQRPMLEAALRAYFRSGRAPGALLEDFDRRWSKAKRRDTAHVTFSNGRRMAEWFLALDAKATDPLRALDHVSEQMVLGHRLLLSHDLLSQAPEGLILRQLLTDEDIRRDEHLRLYAVACLLHFEAGSPLPLARVDVWQLRARKQFTWPRFLLLRQAAVLGGRLDSVAQAFNQDAA